MVIIYTIRFNIKKGCIFLHGVIMVFNISYNKDRDFPKQPKTAGFIMDTKFFLYEARSRFSDCEVDEETEL